jgi:GTPase SAR1 family protein
MKSIFLTGASGVGKSTTYRSLVEGGFTPSPNHLTRPARANEVESFDAHFITVEQFAANMAIKAYLESTMQEAEYGGVYYGSPVTWELDSFEENKRPFVAIPSNAVALRGLLQRLSEHDKRDTVIWANLHAPLKTRRDRVSAYVSDPAQLHHRLYNGIGQGTKPDADINIDTSVFSPTEVLDQVIALAK